MAFTGDYATILADDNITIAWKFAITDKNGNVLNASNQEIWGPGTKFISTETKFISTETKFIATEKTHDFRIDNFSGINLKRNDSELGIQTADTLNFDIINSDSAFTASNFKTGNVVLQLCLSCPTVSELTFYTWKFYIELANETPSKLIKIKAVDIVQQKVKEVWPSTPLISDLVAEGANRGNIEACVPVPIGKPYIPLTPVYHSVITSTLYLLGPTTVNGNAVTYTVYAARSPKEVGKVEYTQYFNQTTIGDYRYFYLTPTSGGATTANLLFQNGERLYDLPVQFSRSDTASLTNPADAIQFILEDMGLEVDTTTFAAAKAIYTTRTLAWNRAWRFKTATKNILAEIQNSCASALRSQETVELIPFDATSLETVSNDNVFLSGDFTSEDTFSLRNVQNNSTNDSGYVAAQEADIPQDELVRVIVPAGGSSTDNPTSDTLELYAVQDSQDVQKLGIMYFQKKLDKENELSFDGFPVLLSFLPDQILTIGTDYAESATKVIIESLNISADFNLAYKCIQFSHELEGWDDITVSGYTVSEDQNQTFYTPVCGSDVEFTTAYPLKNINYEIYDSEVLRTDAAVATNGGVEISNYGMKAYNTDPLLVFDLNISAGTLDLIANLTIKAANNITIEDGGDIILNSLTGTGIAKRGVIKWPVDNSNTITISGDYDGEALAIFPNVSGAGSFLVGFDQDSGNTPFNYITMRSDQETLLKSEVASTYGAECSLKSQFGFQLSSVDLASTYERRAVVRGTTINNKAINLIEAYNLDVSDNNTGYNLITLPYADPTSSAPIDGTITLYWNGTDVYIRGKTPGGTDVNKIIT